MIAPLRSVPAALAALLCLPAVAAAAPFGELAFMPLGGDRAAACLTALGPDRAALVAYTRDADDQVELLRVAADGALVPDGVVPIGRLQRETGTILECPAVAAAASGAAIVAVASGRRGVTVAVRDPGGTFGLPQRFPVPRGWTADHARAAVAPSGAAVVTWSEMGSDGERLRAVRRDPGRMLGAPETVDDDIVTVAPPVVAIDDAGSATAAWVRLDPHVSIRVARSTPGAGFGAAQRLARDWTDTLALAVAPDGGALLAYDGECRVCVFERPPGAARMRRVPGVGAGGRLPAVALASGGGAVVAWRSGRPYDLRVGAALRAPGGAFQPRRMLAAPGARVPRSDRRGLERVTPDLVAADIPDVAVGPDGNVLIGWPESSFRGRDVRPVVAVPGTLSGGLQEPQLLGGTTRLPEELAALTAPTALLWTDNFETPLLLAVPTRGRLHRALPGVTPRALPVPALTLRARPQSLGPGDPVVVRVHCSAACDLEAAAGRDPVYGGPAALANGELDGPGTARLELRPHGRSSRRALRRRKLLRVVVRATAPAGREETIARIVVRIRRPGR